MSVVEVVSASKLSAESVKKIETFFNKKHGEKAEFVYKLEPSLIGGILIKDGEAYYDATVRGQLAVLKRSLQ